MGSNGLCRPRRSRHSNGIFGRLLHHHGDHALKDGGHLGAGGVSGGINGAVALAGEQTGAVLNATKGKKERVGRILQMHANKREELDKVYSGDIAAAIGFKFSTTGDTICDEQHPVILESMEFPEPVIELAIEPKTKASQGKLGESLAKLAEEDPTFRAHTDQETGQTIIAGMGELHLEIIVA